jgi:hypothetical protein
VRRSRSKHVIWIGARLGATLGMKASAAVMHAADRLILWEPVVDGRAYLGELAERYIQTLDLSYNFPNPAWRAMLASGSIELEHEGIGFELGEALREQLGAVSPISFSTPHALRCDIITQGQRPGIADLAQRWRHAGLAVNELRFAHDFDWMAPEALNTALVPVQAIQLLSELVTDPK